jgi:hypothetical protein
MTNAIDEILAEAEDPGHARVTTAKLLLRQDLDARHAELDEELSRAVERRSLRNRATEGLLDAPDGEASELAEQLIALQDEMDAAQRVFKFRAMGRTKYRELLAKHPPTKAQLAESKGLDHNPETFPGALIAAASDSPKLTVADAGRLSVALNDSQFRALYQAALDANLGGVSLPKSMAAGVIHRLKLPSANSADSGESPDLSSLAGS